MTDDPKTSRCRAGTETQRCSFRGDRDELRDHADEMGHSRCIVCAGTLTWHEPQACSRCASRVRDDLDAIAAAFSHLERVIGQGAYHGIAWNALTLAGDGSVTGGGADDHIRYHDPAPAIAVLEQHDREWREEFGHPHPPYHPLGHADRETPKRLLGNVLDYLRTFHGKAAAEHPGFDDYAAEVRELRSRLEHVVGMADDPVRAPAECFDCGGQLVRTYEDKHGLTDDWTCRGCGRVYDQPSYFLALRSRRDECQGWVPVRLAADVLRRPVQSVWWWQQEMLVSSACDVATRQIRVDWAEVAERAAITKQDRRSA